MKYKRSNKPKYLPLHVHTLNVLPKKAQERLRKAEYVETVFCVNCGQPTRHVFHKKSHRHDLLVVCSNPECEWFGKVIEVGT